MSKHITVIDVNVGVPGKYAVRIGPEYSPLLRLANCYNENNRQLVKVAGSDYASNQQYTSYTNFDKAVQVAKSLKANYPSHTVRVDCTIG
jgi:hypothetical protein